jgi:predicted PurR-regulated permease PerM
LSNKSLNVPRIDNHRMLNGIFFILRPGFSGADLLERCSSYTTVHNCINWWLGQPLPILWGAVMGMLSIAPVLGAFEVWVPAAIYLTLEGHRGKALIPTAWGLAAVGTIVNISYPMLVGNRLRLHAVSAFVGAIGGIIAFGAAGPILGLSTISATLAPIKILKKRFWRKVLVVN